MKSVYMFSPLPPVPSGIAAYTHAVAEALATQSGYDVHVVVDQPEVSVQGHYTVHSWREFLYRPLPPESVSIYQVGNSVHHHFVYPFVLTYPGLVVLHDLVLGHGRLQLFHAAHSPDELHAEIAYETDDRFATTVLRAFQSGYAWEHIPFFVPLHRTVIESAVSTAVHNPDTYRTLRMRYPDLHFTYIPMGLWETEPRIPSNNAAVRHAVRTALGIPPGSLLLGTFGLLTPHKGVATILTAMRILRALRYPVYLLLVGYRASGLDVAQLAQDEGVHAYVRIVYQADRRTYWQLLQSVDVCIALRAPPVGECSLSTLEMMAAGRPVIMNRHRFNVFFPEHTCIRINLSTGVDDLIEQVRKLYHRPEIRYRIGQHAQRYVRRYHNFNTTIACYHRWIEMYPHLLRQWRDRRTQFPQHAVPLTRRVHAQIRQRVNWLPDFLTQHIHRIMIGDPSR